MGGMAIRAHAPDWTARTRRTEVDLDFVTVSRDRAAFYQLLEREGYTADRQHNALFGRKQGYFMDVPRKRPVDVLVDTLEMCHRLDFSERLALSLPTLPLADLLLSKLQVVKINRKDVLDALVLLAEHPLGDDDGELDSSHGRGRDERPAHHRRSPRTTGAGGGRSPATSTSSPSTWTTELREDDLDLGGGRPVRFDPAVQVAALRDAIEAAPEVDSLEAPRPGRRARTWYHEPEEMGHTLMRIFFATDIHGSDVCWRKFLNAGKFHKADVLVMGGDMTGKAMVPIVANGQRAGSVTLQEQQHVLATEDELHAMEKRISDRGYYPVRLTRDEVDAWSADPEAVDARFRQEMLRRSNAGWRSPTSGCKGTGIRCIVSPANDDIFEIDPLIEAAELVELGESNTIELDGFTLVSTGWANPTPWNTFRELPEDQLRERIDGLVAEVADPRRAIFNFHAPPYGSNLDNAPKLDADMNYVSGGQALVPVGSHAVRDAILAYGPAAVAARPHPRGHAAPSSSVRTLAVNPGSSYEDGVLQAAIVDLDAKKGEVKRYLLING